jgi:hypothetical protein
MVDYRKAPRRRILKTGLIESVGESIECAVRDLSTTGASLEVSTPLFIPDKFNLAVPSDGLRRRCRVAWRKGKRIGVAFD